MKKSFGMWMTIICILVVGISVTRATREFVSANSGSSAVAYGAETAETAEADGSLEAVPVMAREISDAGSNSRSIAEGQAVSLEEDSEKTAMAEEAADYEAQALSESAEPETVKSPLDPAVESEESHLEAAEDGITISSESFQKRFETAEATAESFRINAASDSSSGQTAAEQEYLLWDYELNLIYSAIRERMSQDEADALKLLELEWMKERDTYADKALAANKGITTRSPEYLRRMTEYTKERCYWLADQYGFVLDRQRDQN